MAHHDPNDLDSSHKAGHHSLGTKHDQAAAGDHKHGDYITRLDNIEAKFIPWAEASGTVTNAALGAGAGVSVAVTFPASRFSVAPNVMVTPSSNGFNAGSVAAITTAGCTVRNWNPQGVAHTGTETIYWLAVQMLSGAANG